MPAWACWSKVSPLRSTGVVVSVAKGTSRRRGLNRRASCPPAHGPRLPNMVLDVGGLVEFFVVIDAEGAPPVWGVAPAPADWGGKKRAATEEATK